MGGEGGGGGGLKTSQRPCLRRTWLKAAHQEQKRELESVETFFESTKRENLSC